MMTERRLSFGKGDTLNLIQKFIQSNFCIFIFIFIFIFILILTLTLIFIFIFIFILIFVIEFIGEPNVSAALRRAAGEALGYLCNAEGDAFTANLVRNVTELVMLREEDRKRDSECLEFCNVG
jgi:ABC-type multidrug transport system fused ATPase/permease subunit